MAVPMSPAPSNRHVRLNSALNELDSTLQMVVEREARQDHFQREWRQQWDSNNEQIAARWRILNEKLRTLQESGQLPPVPQLKVLC